jgi:hypothetical protein
LTTCGKDLFYGSHFLSLNQIPCAHNNWFKPTKPKTKRNHPTNLTSIFITQDFLSWLECLLSLPKLEAMIEAHSELSNTDPTITDNYLYSRALKKLVSFNNHSKKKDL